MVTNGKMENKEMVTNKRAGGGGRGGENVPTVLIVLIR